ncbi:single-stranded DNA-binding protein [Thermosediminibacter litoriperuensis]|uniref:Single-stranded DNA-binding protein n=1 Tax=Thermosediminibacter litoriperuensis TaxID=291989 RepID=A0A5S5AVA1_9FIRM|nr:single-stranded DNA-binding protein [Thermosediminibacter litoriperuensis]TYP56814.1 single-strand binding protein [Thermosediminibacter litoriperuensis]
MINNVTLVGRLTRDPELRKAGDVPVCSFTLAVDRDFLNGEGVRETDFIPVVTWRKLAEACANNLKKGRLVGVTGRIQVRPWEQDGKKRQEMEVVADSVKFLDRNKDEGE